MNKFLLYPLVSLCFVITLNACGSSETATTSDTFQSTETKKDTSTVSTLNKPSESTNVSDYKQGDSASITRHYVSKDKLRKMINDGVQGNKKIGNVLLGLRFGMTKEGFTNHLNLLKKQKKLTVNKINEYTYDFLLSDVKHRAIITNPEFKNNGKLTGFSLKVSSIDTLGIPSMQTAGTLYESLYKKHIGSDTLMINDMGGVNYFQSFHIVKDNLHISIRIDSNGTAIANCKDESYAALKKPEW